MGGTEPTHGDIRKDIHQARLESRAMVGGLAAIGLAVLTWLWTSLTWTVQDFTQNAEKSIAPMTSDVRRVVDKVELIRVEAAKSTGTVEALRRDLEKVADRADRQAADVRNHERDMHTGGRR